MSKNKNKNKDEKEPWREELIQVTVKQALGYHDIGLCVIPLYTKSKVSAVKWKQYQDKRPDRETVETWFKEGIRKIGVIAGDVSNGLTCRDFDTRREYNNWKMSHPDLADTLPTVRTSKGYHVYFRSSAVGVKHIQNGELRGSRCICLLPDSLHKSGKKYEWRIPINGEIPEVQDYQAVFDVFAEGPDKDDAVDATRCDNVESCDGCDASGTDIASEEADRNKAGKENTMDAGDNCVDHDAVTTDLCSLDEVQEAIKATQPKTEGQRNKAIFQFCRWLKAIPSIKHLAAGKLRPVVEEWHRQALNVIGTKAFTETWSEFLYGWPRVKYAKGAGGLEIAVQNALEAEYSLPDEARYEDVPDIQLLIRVCFELQEIQGDEPFWISCKDAGGILGVSHTQANKYLNLLVHDEVPILETIEKNTTRKATRYRFIGKRPIPQKKGTRENEAA